MEILPIKLLRDEDSPIFGGLNVALSKLGRTNIPLASGIIVTPPDIKLKTTLEHFDFQSKEIFEQVLTIIKREIEKIEVPEELIKETKKQNRFLIEEEIITGLKKLWLKLLNLWLEEIKQKIWDNGFTLGLTENLEPKAVIFFNKLEAFGTAGYQPVLDEVIINIKSGKLNPEQLKKIDELVTLSNKKLLIPHEYEWIFDNGIKFSKIKPYTPHSAILASGERARPESNQDSGIATPPRMTQSSKSAVKIFLDLSTGVVTESNIDGVYISSEKVFDLNKPRESFDNLVLRLIECASTFPDNPILVKLADKSEGMGKLRGTLRLLHQKSLLDPLCEAILFVRNKRELKNIHIVIPFVRSINEIAQIKRELAVKKLIRKNNLEIWMEIAVPENIFNLEDYLITGLDGVVLNLDELSAHLGGYDHLEQELIHYKKETTVLIKFLEDGVKLLHKSKMPFIAYGNLTLYPEILDFLVEKGVYGVVVERYEAQSIKDLLYLSEKRMILGKSI